MYKFWTQKDKLPVRIGLAAMLVGGVVGIIASLVLSIDALEIARNPDVALSCNLNSVINCATVAKHPSSSVLGFPNSFIGLITFPVIVTIAVILLVGVRLPRWFMCATQAGTIAGLGFAGWMLYQSFVVIQVFCPWCLLTDAMMILIAFGVFRYNALHGSLYFKPQQMKRFVESNYDIAVTLGALVVLLAFVIAKYSQ